jgi:uncharacterized protein (DUF3820 family)
MKHGRATLPFGKYKGVVVRQLPDDYLSYLADWDGLKEARWNWLRESIMAELRFRGLRDDRAGREDAPGTQARPRKPVPMPPKHAGREIDVE